MIGRSKEVFKIPRRFSAMETSVPPRSPRHAEAPASPDAARHEHNNTLLCESTSSPDLVALSRYKFEMNKGRDGTKVVMVEWDPSLVIAAGLASDPFASPIGSDQAFGNSLGDKSWEVSWNGQGAYLPAADDSAPAHTRRVYYLLPPGSPVPPSINIKHVGLNLTWTLKTLPAIFPPSLGIASSDVGTRGVLHTSWAINWLTKLQNEIDIEMQTNGESVGLPMAMQERRWVLNHFGVAARTSDDSAVAAHDRGQFAAAPTVTEAKSSSPQSPLGGRLSEKLKALKLNTSGVVDLLSSAKQGENSSSFADPQAQPGKLGSTEMFGTRCASYAS